MYMNDKIEEIEVNFTYHAPSKGKVKLHNEIREAGKEFSFLINDLVLDSREKSLALTKIEEAVMWANAGLARNE